MAVNGLIAGWLASLVLGGGGIIRDIFVGIIGSFVGGALVQAGLLKLPFLARHAVGAPDPRLDHRRPADHHHRPHHRPLARAKSADLRRGRALYNGGEPRPELIDLSAPAIPDASPAAAGRPPRARPAKPAWIRVRAPGSAAHAETARIVRAHGLTTVCEEAGCPNIGECWGKRHATFMIMGDTCTRACAFCNVRTGMPRPLDPLSRRASPRRRGAGPDAHRHHLGRSRRSRRRRLAAFRRASSRRCATAAPAMTIEVLTPDFLRKDGALETVLAARPDVFNHNLETVPRLYLSIRPGARYFHSLRLLQRAKEIDRTLFTKSGIMVGLGEAREEVMQVMDDLRSAGVDFLTIGQYLQPSPRHAPVERFVPPDEFDALRRIAVAKGFALVAASPLTRSSYHAGEDFAKLQAARRAAHQ